MSALYRELGPDTFVRYDPARNRYSIVGIDDVPALAPVVPESAEITGHDEDQQRRHELLAAAMIDVILSPRRFTPGVARALLWGLSESLRTPDALARLVRQRDWHGRPARQPPRIDPRPAGARGDAVAGVRLLRIAEVGVPLTRANLMQLATHLPAVPPAEVRRARAILGARLADVWGDPQVSNDLRAMLIGRLAAGQVPE